MKKAVYLITITILVLTILCSCFACSSKTYGDIEKSGDYALGESAFSILEDISEYYPNRSVISSESEDFVNELNLMISSYGYNVEKQDFTVLIDSKSFETSNIVCLKDNPNTDKKIIIGCQWDNCYSYYTSSPDGAYESGAAIASLITLANYLKDKDLNYDLEIAFFGAGVKNWYGAKYYLNKLSAKEKENIQLMINYSMLGSGDNLYMYSRDKSVNYNDYFYQVANANGLNTKKVPTNKRIMDSTLVEDSIYSYSHFGMFGNHVYFMNELIPTLSYASFNWEDKTNPSWSEKKGEENVYETGNDTLETMVKRVGKDYIVNQLNTVLNSTISTIVVNQNSLLNILEKPDEVSTFAQGNTAAYIFGIGVKLVIIVVIIVLTTISINNFKKNKDLHKVIHANMQNNINEEKKDEDVFEEEKQNENDSDDVFQ